MMEKFYNYLKKILNKDQLKKFEVVEKRREESQEGGTRGREGNMTDRLLKMLKLNEEQQKKATALHKKCFPEKNSEEMKKQREALKGKDRDSKEFKKVVQEKKEIWKKNQAEFNKGLKKILNKDQLKKFEEIEKRIGEHRKSGKKGGRDKK